MPGHRLAAPAGDHFGSAARAELAVLGCLSGVPASAAAAAAGMTTAELADAIRAYQTAGRAALNARARNGSWYQANITFLDWSAAEDVVAMALWPRLHEAETNGLVSSWWYIRKNPCWRLRLHPAADTTLIQLRLFIAEVLGDMVTRQLIAGWESGRYEPESVAFGGAGAMDVAHQLFHADSASFLRYLERGRRPAADAPVGRRELSILLCSALLRAAGQEWHEQGDVWHRVAQMRPLDPGTPATRVHALAGSVRQLLMMDAVAAASGQANPLAAAGPWIAATTTAGHALADNATALDRGIRHVLALHVIFHWNRLGLPATTQAALAHSAQAAVMDN